jgi:hypothetical protein
VAVEVVGLEVQQDGDARPQQLHVLQLEARQLGDDPFRRSDHAVERAEGEADVPRDGRTEHRAEERARRRLAVRPGHADERVREDPRRELRIAPHRNAARRRRRDERRLVRDAAALDERADAVEQREVAVVPERPVRLPHLDAPPPERVGGRAPLTGEPDDEHPLGDHRSR